MMDNLCVLQVRLSGSFGRTSALLDYRLHPRQNHIKDRKIGLNALSLGVCLFVLRFYGPVNPMGSCRARSVYLTTRLLGRLSPLSG